MHVGRNGIGVLTIQDGSGVAGLSLLHKGKLSIKLVLALRGNREVEGLAGRNFGVRLIGHRKGDLGARGLDAGQRLIDRALVTVERNVVGAGGVLDLVILAVNAEVLGARHLQVGSQAILVGNGIGTGVLNVVVSEGGVNLRLQCLLVGIDLLGIALDRYGIVV